MTPPGSAISSGIIATDFGYNLNGQENTITDPTDGETMLTFNALGQTSTSEAYFGTADATTTTDTLDGLGDVLSQSVTGPNGTDTTTNTYGVNTSDGSTLLDNDLLYSTADSADGGTDTFSYNDEGQEIAGTSPQGDTTLGYYPDGDLRSTTLPNGTIDANLAIDPVTGNTLLSENGAGQFTFESLDGEGNVASQSGQGVTAGQYQVDPTTGELTQINTTQTGSFSGSSNATTYTYDGDGNLTQVKYADDSEDDYTYAGDTLTGITEPDDVSITESFDSQGQNTGYSATDASSIWSESETLNDQGVPSEIVDTDPSGTYTRDLDYDSDTGLLTSESSGVLAGIKTSYAYNPDQTLASTSLGSDDTTYSEEDYTYDAQGRLSTLDANGTTFTYNYDDGTGLLNSVTSSAGVTTAYTYDTETENLTSITVTNSDDTTLYSVTYAYNNDNQITSAAVTSTDASGTTTTTDWAYTYDQMSQLQSAIASVGGTPVSGQDFTYTYDSAGNETSLGPVNNMNQYTNDSYNGRGDLTDDGTNTYAYNPLNQLVSVTPDSPTSGSKMVTYDYDDEGRRTIENVYDWNTSTSSWDTTADQTLKFAYDGMSLIGTFNVIYSDGVETDTPTQTYTWGTSGLQTIQIWNSAGTSVSKTLIPVADASGNITMLVNAADGSIDATYTYDPYGNVIGSSGNVNDSPFRFGGQYGITTDSIPGIKHMGDRDETVRFLQPDPSGQNGGLNTYVYANNDPINESDPSGLAPAATQPVMQAALQPVAPPAPVTPTTAPPSTQPAGPDWSLRADPSAVDYKIGFVAAADAWHKAYFSVSIGAKTVQELVGPRFMGDQAQAAIDYANAIIKLTNECKNRIVYYAAQGDMGDALAWQQELGMVSQHLEEFLAQAQDIGLYTLKPGSVQTASGQPADSNNSLPAPGIPGGTAKGTLRDRLGNPPKNLKNPQAQHDLPQAARFQKYWNRAGLDIDDPAYGRWVEGTPPGNHQNWSYQFNKEWDDFFAQNPTATKDQILEEMNKLRNDPRFQ